MKATQLDLLKEPKTRFNESHVAKMIEQLKAGTTAENKGWQTSTQLGARSWSEKRDLRNIKAISKGRIVSWPGSGGYKLAEDCTLEEIQHCRRAVVSQVREMLTNVRLIERVAHAAISGR
jgi:hypothetical protein